MATDPVGASQLSFDLPVRTALGRGDFMVAPSNANALAMIDEWPDWPGRKLIVAGPEGAGKTHLAHVWAAVSDANIVPARDLPGADIPALACAPVAVEDADRAAGNAGAERALFHLHNLALAEGESLLFTARTAPRHWGIALPDLASRMGAAPLAALEEPDDALLTAVLGKLFADRQLVPAPDLLPWLVRRMERSFAAAGQLVALLDRAALDRGRPLGRRLAAEVLKGGANGDLLDSGDTGE